MSWNIDGHGDVTPLDDGPKLPWWLVGVDQDEDGNPEPPRPGRGDES